MNEHPTDISPSSARSLFLSGPASGDVSASGRSLEQLSNEEFWRYAHVVLRFIEGTHRMSAVAQPQEYLTCRLSRGECLIPLPELYEVVRPPHHIALLPVVPAWMFGIVAWRGEPIAVIDLDAYLSGSTRHLQHDSMLLIAKHMSQPFGLLAPAIGQTVLEQSVVHPPDISIESVQQVAPWCLPTRIPFVKGLYAEALVLDISALLTDVLHHIEIAASNG